MFHTSNTPLLLVPSLAVLLTTGAAVHGQGLRPLLEIPLVDWQAPYARGGGGGGAGGVLMGQAAIIRAQGQFMIDNQRAILLQEEVKAKRLENRRKRLEQWLWERDNLPTAVDERLRAQRETLRHGRNDPPITEIWSAKALNDLLVHAQRMTVSVPVVDSAVLDPKLLARINVTSGKGGNNIGLLKAGTLPWPLLLRRSPFDAERTQIDGLLPPLLAAARKGKMPVEILDRLLVQTAHLQQQLPQRLRAATDAVLWTPTQYLDARRFLDQLQDALKQMQEPNAADYLNGTYAAQGKTAGDLVRYMKENGLQFAPATAGSFEAYAALYQALRDYEVRASAAVDSAQA